MTIKIGTRLKSFMLSASHTENTMPRAVENALRNDGLSKSHMVEVFHGRDSMDELPDQLLDLGDQKPALYNLQRDRQQMMRLSPAGDSEYENPVQRSGEPTARSHPQKASKMPKP